jgi:hypothetical protein
MATRQQSEILKTNLRPLLKGSPIEKLQAISSFIAVLREIERTAVAQARHTGASWTDIGNALGVTKQAAFQKYGPIIDAQEQSR